MVRLVVADDHPMIVEGLARLLPDRDDVVIVARCSDGRAALAAIRAHRPDVALVDLYMPLLNGREVLNEVVRLKLPTAIVMLSAHAEPPIVRAVLEEGARGYLDKRSEWQDIVAAVPIAAAGEVVVSPSLQADLNAQISSPVRMPSVRELKVLEHASFGLTDAQIGGLMYISRETVRTNLKRCSEKLGVSGRTALVATALRKKFLQ